MASLRCDRLRWALSALQYFVCSEGICGVVLVVLRGHRAHQGSTARPELGRAAGHGSIVLWSKRFNGGVATQVIEIDELEIMADVVSSAEAFLAARRYMHEAFGDVCLKATYVLNLNAGDRDRRARDHGGRDVQRQHHRPLVARAHQEQRPHRQVQAHGRHDERRCQGAVPG